MALAVPAFRNLDPAPLAMNRTVRTFRRQAALLAALLSTVLPATLLAQAERRVALVVGNGAYQNAGQLIMNSNRSGELTTTTPHNDVEVIVTAEASATPPEPSHYMVLQGTANRQ